MSFSTAQHRGKAKLNIKGILFFGVLVTSVLGLIVYIAFFAGAEPDAVQFPSNVTGSPGTRSDFRSSPAGSGPSAAYQESSRNFDTQQETAALRRGEMVVTNPLPSRVEPAEIPQVEASTNRQTPPSFSETPARTEQAFFGGEEFSQKVSYAQSLVNSWAVKGMGQSRADELQARSGRHSTTESSDPGSEDQVLPVVVDNRPSSPVIQAGSFVYAQSVSAANSEVPAAIRFDLIGHPLGRAWVIANYVRKGEYLDIQATLLVLEGRPAIPINAVIVNMAGSPAVRNKVNRQLLKKYGLPAVARFFQGLGAAASIPEQIITIGSSETTTVEQSRLSFKEQALAGASTAAESIADDLEKEAGEVQPIVTLNANEPVQVFFLQDVFLAEGLR